jgi:preprotein translocase subunit SecD
MLEFARWKYILAALILVIATVYSLPNLFPQDSAVQISANRGNSVDVALRERVQGVLETQKIGFKRIEIEGDNLLVRLADPSAQLRAADAVRGELGTGYVVALNLASTVPDWLTSIGAKPMSLGLDLQGGVHFMMEVDERGALEKRENGFLEDIRSLLRDEGVRYSAVDRGGNGLLVKLSDAAERDRAASLISGNLPQLQVTDSADPAVLTLRVAPNEIRTIMDNAVEQNIGTLRNRINALGVAEPVVQRQGSNRIVVQLPGIQDAAQAKKILGATATLEYRAQADGSPEEAAASGRVPPNARLYYMRDTRMPVLLDKRILASGDQLVDARAGFDSQSNSPMVSITLNNVAGGRMLDFTTENVGRRMGVVYIERIPETRIVDGKEVRTARITEEVINYATVQGVFGKNFQTTGLESPKEASELALLLRAGSLAAPVDIIAERVISPTLGADNIERGWKAVVYSFLFVLAFFVVYYKMFGVITNLALLLNLLLVVAVMSLLDATLTLPGLAGIALTIGMSVDANVLINERIREELRGGNTPLSSIAAGYDKAAGTIADANVTALLAGVALFAFGTGPVKGFAVSLCVGILTSMYTAVSVSRGISTLIYGGRRKLSGLSI